MLYGVWCTAYGVVTCVCMSRCCVCVVMSVAVRRRYACVLLLCVSVWIVAVVVVWCGLRCCVSVLLSCGSVFMLWCCVAFEMRGVVVSLLCLVWWFDLCWCASCCCCWP